MSSGQDSRASRPLKRFFQGRPLSIPPPSRTILNWELEKRSELIPEYNLSELNFPEIEAHRSLYVKKLEELIRLPAFPADLGSWVGLGNGRTPWATVMPEAFTFKM